jgi:hypothetical protein
MGLARSQPTDVAPNPVARAGRRDTPGTDPTRNVARGYGRIARTMTVWFVAAVPPLIMLFALAMERLERRLRRAAVQDNDTEELLQAARPDEMQALFGSGIGGALSRGRDGLVRSRRAGQRS